MAEFGPDILHQILIRLDAVDLVRYKRVCKLWLSVISDQRFIKSHLNYSYNKSSIMGHKRIVESKIECEHKYNDRVQRFLSSPFELFGSVNGLICFYGPEGFFVVNPFTGEVRELPKPLRIPNVLCSVLCCWGFGYDSSADDYKVIIGSRATSGDSPAHCQVLSLKSNVWKFIGELQYTAFTTRATGTFCNGALHWIMYDEEKKKKVIVSFDLAQEMFKEIPQPDDARYRYTYDRELGVMQDNLCIFGYSNHPYHKWIMTNYNVKQSWESKQSWFLVPFVRKSDNNDASHFKAHVQHKCSFGHVRIWFNLSSDDISAPIFVPSLVSPHVQIISKEREIGRQ